MTDPDRARNARFPLPLNRLGAERTDLRSRQPLRPQRLLREAAQDAARQVTPSGIGLDSALVRMRLIDRLRSQGGCADAVLAAMAVVPRHLFIDTALAAQAYEDTSLPIGHGQTISKPSVVALMLSLLFEGQSARADGHLGRVLEIGTGCGYQTAILAHLAREVVSIERLRALHDRARVHLQQPAPGARLSLLHGDGMKGCADRAPYRCIVSAAGGEVLPEAWLVQLAVGGRLVAPVRRPGGEDQVLMVVDKGPGDVLRQSLHDGVRFVPLKSGTM